MLIVSAGNKPKAWRSSTLYFTSIASQNRNLNVYLIVRFSKILRYNAKIKTSCIKMSVPHHCQLFVKYGNVPFFQKLFCLYWDKNYIIIFPISFIKNPYLQIQIKSRIVSLYLLLNLKKIDNQPDKQTDRHTSQAKPVPGIVSIGDQLFFPLCII